MNSPSYNRLLSYASKPRRRTLLLATIGAAATATGGILFLKRNALIRPQDTPKSSTALFELEQAAKRGELCSSANPVGAGLRGDYYASENCQGPLLLSRIDPLVDFDMSFDWPAAQSSQRPHSVRWSGWIKPPLAGVYRFHCDAAGARLLVSRIVQVGEGSLPDTHIDLAAGRFSPLVVQLSQLSNIIGRVRLEWTAPHGARFVIPRQLLHLPSDTVSTVART